MDNEFPPLPRPSLPEGVEHGAPTRQARAKIPITDVVDISPDGDVLLDCTVISRHARPTPPGTYLVRVDSTALKESSDYFSVLLDPDKFHEGRLVVDTIARLEAKYGSHSMAMRCARYAQLPRLTIELPPFSPKAPKADVIKTYFGVLSLVGQDDSLLSEVLSKLVDVSVPFLASLVVLSDRFASHIALAQAFEMASSSKIIHRLYTFQSVDEPRIREAIYLALFLQNHEVMGRLTHRLILQGSVNWLPDAEHGDAGFEKPLWWHLPNGIEEELQIRREHILNTISSLQTHFLNAYGAINPFQLAKPSPSTSQQLQCRRAIGNSRACDSFHLGEMIQFFTTRSKTLLLESAISTTLELDFDEEDSNTNTSPRNDSNHMANNQNYLPNSHISTPAASQPVDIRAIIASLRECPEYQIDDNHHGCGIRRRLIPILDTLEGFMGLPDSLGICIRHCDFINGKDSWNNMVFRDNTFVTVHYRGISTNLKPQANGRRTKASGGDRVTFSMICDCMDPSARALFTAKSRRWEE